MEFTGERFIPTEPGSIRLEHYHRYAIALDAVSGKTVLDVACGEGYGSALMSDVARSVVGVDISADVVRHATRSYSSKENLKFVQGSASALGFDDASFEVIVSFETIEHLAEQAEMLAEFRRVLHPRGSLIISSPNRPVYAEQTGQPNAFHVKELDFREFNQVLKSQFPAVRFYGQRMMTGSVIQLVDGSERYYRTWHDDGNTIKPQSASFSEPVYFVAVCAAETQMLPTLDASLAYSNQFDLGKQYGELVKDATRLANDIVAYQRQAAEFDRLLKSSQEELRAAYAHIENQTTSIAAYQHQAAEFDRLLKSSREELRAAYVHIEGQTKDIAQYQHQAAEFDRQLTSSREELRAAYAHIENQTSDLAAYEHQASLYGLAQLEAQSLAKSLQNQNEALQQLLDEFSRRREVELQNPLLLSRQLLRALLRKLPRRAS